MAADYVAEIQRVQPHGPYLIAGHSFGGLVSFEIAQRLVGKGECVSFLGLIDTGLVDRTAGGRVFVFLEKLRSIRESVLRRWYILKLQLGYAIRYERRPGWYDWLCSRASRDYVPKSYTGHITMFSSSGNSEQQKAHWGPLARGGLTVLEMSAGHDDIVLPPHSKILAEQFDACLDMAACRK
jgi:thioesterase domain-containing protein